VTKSFLNLTKRLAGLFCSRPVKFICIHFTKLAIAFVKRRLVIAHAFDRTCAILTTLGGSDDALKSRKIRGSTSSLQFHGDIFKFFFVFKSSTVR